MKKVFTILMAMVIVMAAFAQSDNVTIQMPQKAMKDVFSAKAPIVKHNANQGKNAPSSFWFNYGEGLENLMQLPDGLEAAGVPMCADTNVYFNWSNSDPGPTQFQSTGHLYDWTHSCWETFYYGSTFSNVPALWATDNYSLDSVEFAFRYTDAENVDASVVDTLEICYVLNLDNEHVWQYRSIDQTTLDTMWYNAAIDIPIDPNTCMPTYSNVQFGPSDQIELDPAVQIYTQKFPLTIADTSDYYQVKAFATPAELSNLSCDRLAIFYTFRPGTQGHTVMDSTCRRFTFYTYIDPRDEYTNGGDIPRGDMNMNYSATDITLQTTTGWEEWYAKAFLDLFWTRDRYHTYIGMLASCNDCAIVNVEEMDKNNVTIYPNPATTEITVNNNTNEKTLVEMFNLVGQKVYSEQFVNTTKINVSNMKAGVYMLKVNNHTTKVVVR